MDTQSAACAPDGALGPGSLQARVFVSYSRVDISFAQLLVEELKARGFDAFLDKTDIAPGEPWRERLAGLIGAADTIVFVVSPASAASRICGWELEESTRLGKRIIPLVARPIADSDAPAALARLNWIFCDSGDDRAAAFALLDEALRTDLAWVREHTRLGEHAKRWDDQGRPAGATLRGNDIEAAERWLDRRPAGANAPTALHQDFVRSSRRAATRRQRYSVGGAILVALVAVTLAAFAEVNRRDAQHQRRQADAQRSLAEQARNDAQTQRDRAETALKEAQAQRDRAERALARGVEAANTLVFTIVDKLAITGNVPIEMFKSVIDPALAFADALVEAGETDPALLHAQVSALLRVAPILSKLSDIPGASAAIEKARDTSLALMRRFPDNAYALNDVALSSSQLGSLLDIQGKSKAALEAYREALDMVRDLKKFDVLAKSDANRMDAIDVEIEDLDSKLGQALLYQNRNVEALAFDRDAFEIARLRAAEKPTDTLVQVALPLFMNNLARALVRNGEIDAALDHDRRALDIATALLRLNPSNANIKEVVARCEFSLGDLLFAQRRFPDALPLYRDALKTMAALADADQGNAAFKSSIVLYNRTIAEGLDKQGKHDEALQAYQEALNVQKLLVSSNPQNIVFRNDLGVIYNNIGVAFLTQSKPAEALGPLRLAREAMEIAASSNPANIQWRLDLALTYLNVGNALALRGDDAQALKSYQDGIANVEAWPKSEFDEVARSYALSDLYGYVGTVQADQQKFADALNSFTVSLGFYRQAVSSDMVRSGIVQLDLVTSRLIEGLGNVSMNLTVAGDFAHALTAAEEALTIAPDQIWLQGNRANALMLLGRTEEARDIYRKYKSEQHIGPAGNDGAPSWIQSVLSDFKALRDAGFSSPLMGEIEEEFSAPK